MRSAVNHRRLNVMTSISPSILRRVILHFFLIALALGSLIPFFWLICASFKNSADFFSHPFLPWRHPERWTLGNYTFLFEHYAFARWMLNSLFISCLQTSIVVTLCSLGGFCAGQV